jgi:U3 small nucleolar RNA-associated protein 13
MTREGKVPTTYKVTQTIGQIVVSGPLDVLHHEDKVSLALIGPKGMNFWDLEDGNALKEAFPTGRAEEQEGEAEAEEDEEQVSTFAVAKDGSYFVAKNKKNLVEAWSSQSGSMQLVKSWKGHGSPVLCMAHHAVSPLLAVGCADHSIRVFDSAQGFCTHNLKGVHGAPISALQFGSAAELFSAADDGSVALWDLHNSAKPKAVFRRHVSSVRALALCERRLVTGGRDRMINVWSLSGKLERSIPCDESVESLIIQDSATFFAAGEKGTVRCWDMNTGSCVKESQRIASTGHSIVSMKLIPEKSSLVLLTSDQQIAVLNPNNLAPTAFFPGSLGEVTDLALLPGALAIASNDPDVRVMTMHGDAIGACQVLRGHSEAVLCVAASGDWLLSGSRDSTVRLWKRAAGGLYEAVADLAGHTDAVSAVCFSPATPTVFASAGADSTLKLWEVSPADNHVHARWTVKAHDKDINSVAISPNGKIIVTGSQDKTAKLWRVSDGAPVATLSGHRRGIWSVCFSPFEQVIATASGDHTVKLWSALSHQCLKTLEGHANSVLRAAWGEAANDLLSSGSDGLVKLWDLRAGECTTTLDEHTDRIWCLSLRGDSMATGDASGTIRLWRNATGEAIEEARKAQEAFAQMEQNLANLLLRSDLRNAVVLALELEQPFRIFALLNSLTRGESNTAAQEKLSQLLSALPLDKLDRLCLYIRDWNTSFRRALLAQLVLNTILRLHPMETLREGMPHLKETAKAILPYTQRHFAHTQELMTSARLVDFVLAQMNGHLA